MLKIRKGVTRVVILIGKFAIKFPRGYHSSRTKDPLSWKWFLRGLLANIDEKFWWDCTLQKDKLCKIRIAGPLGLFLIMDRAEPLLETEYDKEFFEKEFKYLPLDNKICNFGKINDRIVLVDYADSRYLCSDCSDCFKNR